MDIKAYKLRTLLFALLVISSTVSIVNANMADDVTNSIANGVDLFIIRLVNGFVNSAVADGYGVGDDPSNSSITLDAIFSIGTYTPNPFEVEYLHDFRSNIKMLYFDMWWYFIMFAMITVMILYFFSADSVSDVEGSTGIDIFTGVKKLFKVIVGGILIYMFEMAFVWIVLLVNDEMSKTIMMGSLAAIAITPDNLLLYAMMGLAYAALWLCFEYRILVIYLFSSAAFLFGALLLWDLTSRWAWKAHLYFIQIVFFQFAIVLWYSFCILVITSTHGRSTGLYLLMVLVSIYFSYKFIFKLDFVRMAGQLTRIVIIKKL